MTSIWRIWGLVSASIAAGLIGLVVLATMQFETTLTNLVHGRLSVLAQSIDISFRSTAALGLPLSSVRNATAILERVRQTDPVIANILVHDQEGRIVHSTARDGGSEIDSVMLQAYRTAPDDIWRVETAGHLFSGTRILNVLRTQPIGGIVIIYPKTDIWTATLAMAARLILAAVAVAVVAASLSFLLLRLVLHRLDHSANAIATGIDELEREGWRAPGVPPHADREAVPASGGEEHLIRDARTAIQRYAAVARDLGLAGKPGGKAGGEP